MPLESSSLGRYESPGASRPAEPYVLLLRPKDQQRWAALASPNCRDSTTLNSRLIKSSFGITRFLITPGRYPFTFLRRTVYFNIFVRAVRAKQGPSSRIWVNRQPTQRTRPSLHNVWFFNRIDAHHSQHLSNVVKQFKHQEHKLILAKNQRHR